MPPLGSEATDGTGDGNRIGDADRSSDANRSGAETRSDDATGSSDDRRPADVTPTTILLSRDGEHWRATQRGVEVVGSGATAPQATAAYCRLLEERSETDGACGADGDATGDVASKQSRDVDRR